MHAGVSVWLPCPLARNLYYNTEPSRNVDFMHASNKLGHIRV